MQAYGPEVDRTIALHNFHHSIGAMFLSKCQNIPDNRLSLNILSKHENEG